MLENVCPVHSVAVQVLVQPSASLRSPSSHSSPGSTTPLPHTVGHAVGASAFRARTKPAWFLVIVPPNFAQYHSLWTRKCTHTASCGPLGCHGQLAPVASIDSVPPLPPVV